MSRYVCVDVFARLVLFGEKVDYKEKETFCEHKAQRYYFSFELPLDCFLHTLSILLLFFSLLLRTFVVFFHVAIHVGVM